MYGLGRGVVALNNTNHTNILVGNDISGKGAYGSVVVGTSATVSNSHHSQVVIGRSTNSTATSTVIIGNAAEANDSYGISIGDNAGNTSNTKGINIGGNAKGKGEKGIVISSLGSINISPTKANTFGVYTHGTQPVLEIEATGSSLLTGSSFTIEKSGSTVFNVIGSEGDLFTITDSLTSGSLFAVKDISGFPLLDVTKKHDGTPDLVTVGQSDLILDSGSIQVTGSVNISNSLTVNGSAVGAAFPFSGDAQITGSLNVSSSITTFDINMSTWTLGADGGSNYYYFTGPGDLGGTEQNPDIHLTRGQKYRFYNPMDAHPFQIQHMIVTGKQ